VSVAVPDEPTTLHHQAEAAQAAYYRAVLVEKRVQLVNEIARRRLRLEQHVTSGEARSRLRRELRTRESEHRDVERLISALDHRFLAIFN
jgi:hypothetical protein